MTGQRIVVDTSALMAILLDEPEASACIAAMADAGSVLISAATAAEAQIVADRRGVGAEMRSLLAGTGMEFVPVTATAAIRVADAYARFGRGQHPARLNFGDCFAYEAAAAAVAPLLFVGDDFRATDMVPALAGRGALKTR